MICSRLIVVALLVNVARAACAQTGAITLDSLSRTYAYPGIGPLTWAPVHDIKAFIGVPEFSGGPRVLCHADKYSCEIDVNIRNVSYFAHSSAELLEEVKQQFVHIYPAPPANAKFSTFASANLIQATYVDTQPGAKYKYTTMAIVLKGPAVLQVVAQAADSATIASMLNIAVNAKGGAFRELLAYRFAQFTGACTAKMPASKVANERALASSPFNEAYLLQERRKGDSTMTLGKLHEIEAKALPDFIATFDELKPDTRTKFCSQLPSTMATSAREFGR